VEKEHFYEEIEILKKEWPRGFSEEKIKAIWSEAKFFNNFEFTRVRKEFVSKRGVNQPPVPNDFSIEFSKIREKIRYNQKRRESEEVNDFMSGGSLSEDEMKFRMNIILSRIAGKVSDKDWKDFMRLIK